MLIKNPYFKSTDTKGHIQVEKKVSYLLCFLKKVYHCVYIAIFERPTPYAFSIKINNPSAFLTIYKKVTKNDDASYGYNEQIFSLYEIYHCTENEVSN